MVSIEGHESKIFDLMKLDGERFVNESYALLLGRHPDSEGFMYYMWRLRRGISKRKIILQLLKAPEAVAMREANSHFSRDIDEWQKKTASIKYTLRSFLKIFLRKKSSADSETDFIRQMNAIAGRQAIINYEITAFQADFPNSIDARPERIQEYQMSRQAQYIYNALLQPDKYAALDGRILCE